MMTYEDIIEELFKVLDVLDYGGCLDEEEQEILENCRLNFQILQSLPD